MNVGDLVHLPRQAPAASRLWRVTGVFYGAQGQESVASIVALDRTPAWAPPPSPADAYPEGWLYELYVPVDLITPYLYTKAPGPKA